MKKKTKNQNPVYRCRKHSFAVWSRGVLCLVCEAWGRSPALQLVGVLLCCYGSAPKHWCVRGWKSSPNFFQFFLNWLAHLVFVFVFTNCHTWVWGNYSPLSYSRDKNLAVNLELGEILWSQPSKCWDCRINHHTWFPVSWFFLIFLLSVAQCDGTQEEWEDSFVGSRDQTQLPTESTQ